MENKSFDVLEESRVDLPELRKISKCLEGFEAQAEKIREGAKKVKFWVNSALSLLDQINKLSPEARDLAVERTTSIQRTFNDLLKHNVLKYRQAAWLSLFNYEFSKDYRTRKEVEELVEKLVKERRLIDDPQGELRIYNRHLRISPEARFEEKEVAEIEEIIKSLLARVENEETKRRGQRVEELKARADITLQDLCDGRPGKCFLSVPPERVENGGQAFWRGGGTLLVESDGEKILPFAATGTIEAAIEEVKNLRIHLLVSSLRNEKAPVVLALPPEMNRKVQLLWHLIKRAIRQEEVKTVAAAFARKATISAQEFFLEKKPGICLVEFQGIWETPTGERIPNLFFLVERRKRKKDQTEIILLEVPEHLNGFFACMGEEYPEKDNKFQGVEQPLRAVLQAVYGQTVTAKAKNKKLNP